MRERTFGGSDAAHNHPAYLERPFQEAMAAMYKRMHDLGIPR
jgi:hypothetical protein